MSLVTVATALAVVMLVTSVVLGWVADVKRSGGAVSARESRAASEQTGRATFYTSREDRAAAMRDRIRKERRRRERARATAGAGQAQAPPPRPERPVSPPPESPEARHRAILELGPGEVTAAALRRQYRLQVAAYHPDRVAGLGVKLQRLAEEETKAINQAYAFFKAGLRDD